MDYKNIKIRPEKAVEALYAVIMDMPGEHENRLASFASALKEAGLDSAIIDLSRDQTGKWLGTAENGYAIVTSSGCIETIPGISAFGVEKLRALCGTKIAVSYQDDLSVTDYDCLAEAFPDTDYADAVSILDQVKAVKSAVVLDIAKSGAKTHDMLFSAVASFLRPGRLEHDVVCDIREAAYQSGSGGKPPAKYVRVDLYSAPDGAEFNYEPVKYPGRELCYGDTVTIRLQTNGINGYFSGLARAWSLGEPSTATCKLWDIAVAAQDVAAKHLVPGATLGEAAKALKEWVEAQNCELIFPKTAMYGVGLSAAEAPMLMDPSEDMPLAEGMTIFVAPRISKDNLTPLSCGDMYLISESGAKRINNFPRELFTI